MGYSAIGRNLEDLKMCFAKMSTSKIREIYQVMLIVLQNFTKVHLKKSLAENLQLTKYV